MEARFSNNLEDEPVSISLESDGTLSLLSLKQSFPNAGGLKYQQNETWKSVEKGKEKFKVADVPDWRTVTFIVVPEQQKRLRFNLRHATSLAHDEAETFFLEQALGVTEAYLNVPSILNIFPDVFAIPIEQAQEHIGRVVVENSRWKMHQLHPDFALSWIDKLQVYRIFINQKLWHRYRRTTNRDEKERIAFIVGVNVIHQLGHLALQWSPCPEFERLPTKDKHGNPYTITFATLFIGREAGNCFSDRIFNGELAVIFKIIDLMNWTEKRAISRIVMIKENSISANVFHYVYQDYISRVVNGSQDPSQILWLVKMRACHISETRSALINMCGTEPDDLMRPISTVFNKCGTQILYEIQAKRKGGDYDDDFEDFSDDPD